MVENISVLRSDIDILDDIHNLVYTYPPASHDRDFFHVTVKEGVATVSGHVRSVVVDHWMRGTLSQVEGLHALNLDTLYNDDDLRLQIGHLVPPGVFVNVNHGAVTLTGRLPQGLTDAELVQRVAAVKGVTRIGTLFK